jgi:hypothetical protein
LWKKPTAHSQQYIHMASMNYFLNKNESRTIRVTWYLYKQWEFLLLFKHSLNIAIIQLHSKERKRIISSIQNHDHSVEGDLANANSAQTVLYFFLLMQYKASTCKICGLCAVGFFDNFYLLMTICLSICMSSILFVPALSATTFRLGAKNSFSVEPVLSMYKIERIAKTAQYHNYVSFF